MATKQKTLTADGTGADAARMLEHEFIQQMMAVYRADHPQSTEADAALYERMRLKFHAACPHLEFNSLDNLPTAKALDLMQRGKTERAGALLEEHYMQQRLVAQGQIHGERSKAGNDAQAMVLAAVRTPLISGGLKTVMPRAGAVRDGERRFLDSPGSSLRDVILGAVAFALDDAGIGVMQ